MDSKEIEDRIAHFDSTDIHVRLQAQTLEKQVSEGGSGAWSCTVQGGRNFIVKLQNNRHETYSGGDRQSPRLPLKMPPTELICGRLGRLFKTPVCPDTTIIDVSQHLVDGKVYRSEPIQLMAGPSVGSEFVEGCVTSKSGAYFPKAPPEQAARIVVFRTWLKPADDQEIYSADQNTVLSIDHGWYLTGANWGDHNTRLTETSNLGLPALDQAARAVLEDPSLFRPALDELMGFSEDDIIRQFASLPLEWGMTCEFRAQLAAFVLARRPCVEASVSTLWRR